METKWWYEHQRGSSWLYTTVIDLSKQRIILMPNAICFCLLVCFCGGSDGGYDDDDDDEAGGGGSCRCIIYIYLFSYLFFQIL